MFKEIINYYKFKKINALKKLVCEKTRRLDNLRGQADDCEKIIFFSIEQINMLKNKLEEQEKNKTVEKYNKLLTEQCFILNKNISFKKPHGNSSINAVAQKEKLEKTMAAIKLELDNVKSETIVQEYIKTNMEYNKQQNIISQNEVKEQLLNEEIKKAMKEKRVLKIKLSKFSSKKESGLERLE